MDQFRNFVGSKREKVSELALKLDRLQMPIEKPSFDLIYETKIRHERVRNEERWNIYVIYISLFILLFTSLSIPYTSI